MKRIVTMMCLATLMVGMTAHAQFRQSIFLNGELPVGAFGSSVNASRYVQTLNTNTTQAFANVPLGYQEIAQGATAGFGAGYRASYRFDVGVGMVAPFAQADMFVNFSNGDIREEYSRFRGNTPTYFNVPLQVGISYMYDELPYDIIPYGELGLGADILFITKEGNCQYRDTLGTVQHSLALKYKPSVAFAFSIGAGAYFGRHVSAGLYYYFLGTHSLDYAKSTANALQNIQAPDADHPTGTANYSEYDYYQDNPENRTLGTLMLRIGFHF